MTCPPLFKKGMGAVLVDKQSILPLSYNALFLQENEERAFARETHMGALSWTYEWCVFSFCNSHLDSTPYAEPAFFEGMVHFHRKRVIHRDIKSLNVFLSSDERVLKVSPCSSFVSFFPFLFYFKL